ncbi:uncharacterized mitochondrial protein AtMg00810-like [Dioscorea cayenensis subsp. rotundata]|uniref:Uncharacterized mitochondrial protein AtMg00810-like n=1 Tax=Dioscorea cayennensis subsp. rotundata TaxID=55577 RepID=A0AB40BNF3_DIOCR|nr:uncharacterized mitochondrial protein AtMg00810-like [Dioscorea cayenensis subsp. rotundata]
MLLPIGVYTDDLIINGSRIDDNIEFKDQMQKLFDMSDLRLLSYYLGIEVKQNDDTITVCQSNYAQKILEVSSMVGCNPCLTPMENRLKLRRKDCSSIVDATKNRSIIGSIRYLVNTKPDIVYVVGIVSRYMETPTMQHMAAIKHILRYVSGMVNFGCCYKKHAKPEPELVAFSDSDLAGDLDDCKSTTGMVFFLGTSLITWASQK